MNRGRNNMNENSIKKESGDKKYKHSRRRGGAPRDGGTSGVPRGSAGVPPRDGGTSGVPPPNGGSFARCVVPGVGGGGNRSGSGTRKQKDNTKSKNRSTRGGGGSGDSGGGGGGGSGGGGGGSGGLGGGGGGGSGGGGGGSGGGGGGVSVVADVSGHGNVIKTNPFLVALLSKPEPVKNNDRRGSGSDRDRDRGDRDRGDRVDRGNVFLNNNNHRNHSSFQKRNDMMNTSPNSSTDAVRKEFGSDERVKINYFIHNSTIQNDRRRSSQGSGELNNNAFRHATATATTSAGFIAPADVTTFINTNDTVQFPELGGSGKQSSSNNNNKVLNFKDIIVKQAATAATTATTATPDTHATPVAAVTPVRGVIRGSVPPPPPAPVRNLSRGNIFLGAFYKTDGDDGDDGGGDDGGGDGGGGGSERVIMSALVDSCDRSYDKLYK